MSHLTRGAWIEIALRASIYGPLVGRTSHEVRGLKYIILTFKAVRGCRTSHEVRGLKWHGRYGDGLG